MTQRSPHNARYQKHTKPKGQTRKSAAAAKPKRDSSAPSPSTSSKPAGTSAGLPPMTRETRIWRNIWWGMLGGAIVFSALSWIFRDVRPYNTVLLVVAYGLIFGGLAIDFLKVRPARLGKAKSGKTESKSAADPAGPDRAGKKKDAAHDETES